MNIIIITHLKVATRTNLNCSSKMTLKLDYRDVEHNSSQWTERSGSCTKLFYNILPQECYMKKLNSTWNQLIQRNRQLVQFIQINT